MKGHSIFRWATRAPTALTLVFPSHPVLAQSVGDTLKPQGFAAYVPAILIILGIITILLGVIYYFAAASDYWNTPRQ